MKNFLNSIKNLYIKIPIYLRGVFIFAIILILAFLFNKLQEFKYKKYDYKSPEEENNYSIIIETSENKIQKGQLKAELKSKINVPTLKINNKSNENDDLLQITEEDYYFGDEKAPITIVEYSSYTCPHCINFHKNSMASIKKDFIDTGKVKYTKRLILTRDTILANILPYCAKEENRYELVEDIYSNLNSWIGAKNKKEVLKGIAMQNGFTENEFENCTTNKKLINSLFEKQNKEARKLKIFSTPTFFINNERLNGSLPYEAFKSKINEELSKNNN